MTQRAPRLHLLFARDAPRAVILRRGPSAWYHVMRWNLLDDSIEHGAWFKGRLYEERCDLSPDGELLIYFALKGTHWNTSYSGSWSAVSRAPWLHALALWPQGHTWGGGGYFEGPRHVVLNACSDEAHPDHPAHGLSVRVGSRPASPPRGAVDANAHSVFVRNGRIYRGDSSEPTLVADFNDLMPKPSPPPAWASLPLDSLRAHKRRMRRKLRR